MENGDRADSAACEGRHNPIEHAISAGAEIARYRTRAEALKFGASGNMSFDLSHFHSDDFHVADRG